MKIHFSNVNFNSQSGPNSFAYRLAHELAKNDKYEIVSEREDYDIFLCFIEPASIPKKESKFIHRLDGIWFKPEEFVSHNKNIKWAYNHADHVVWQSKFDKKMTSHHWGMPRKGSVIHNGIRKIDFKSLYPKVKKIKNIFDRIFVCSANWHRQKRLKENIEFFLKHRNENDVLLILGNNPDVVINNKHIIYLGHQTHDICLQIYSIADWFLHLAWLDHCPNVVIEALSQGCPVICTDSGGTKEIVKNNGIVIKENNLYKYELTNYDRPYDLIIDDVDLSKNILIDNDYIDIKNVVRKYEELF